MKRTLLAVSLVVFCFAAVVLAAPYFLKARETVRRQHLVEEAAKNEVPLVLDAKTQAILAGADRVETFRLVDFHEEEGYTKAEYAEMTASRKSVGDHQVLYAGPVQGKQFAEALKVAVATTPGQIRKDGLMSGVPSCFDPGVGFRAWNGKSSVDFCVCFYCTAIEIDTNDAVGRSQQKLMTTLGSSWPIWLALSRQAFPQDKRLAAL